MNQDQVKQKLLEIHQPSKDFTFLFSGKTSKTYNGCYHSDKAEIIVHNKNFERNGVVDENSLMYTSIHEFAHHVRHLRGPVSSKRPHDAEFKIIFNDLLKIAIKKGIYNDKVFGSPEFVSLTKTIKEDYIAKNAELMKEFGSLLNKAFRMCQEQGLRFDQYCEQELQFNLNEATTLMRIDARKVPTDLGLEKMKIVANIANESKREMVENALREGEKIEAVRQELIDKPKPQSVKERLLHEREELQHRIASLQRKLEQIEESINSIDK